jgi:hypothetical protein
MPDRPLAQIDGRRLCAPEGDARAAMVFADLDQITPGARASCVSRARRFDG